MNRLQTHRRDFESQGVAALRADLALALRAAAFHRLAEGICNHFSVELQDGSGRFLLNPQGLLWSEIHADDIVLVDAGGQVLAGRHPVESTAMFIHAAVHRIAGKACVLHTHMPHATALTLTVDRALDTTLSQTAMRFHGRLAPSMRTTTAWHWTRLKASASRGRCRAPTSRFWAITGSSSVAVGSIMPTMTCITWSVPA